MSDQASQANPGLAITRFRFELTFSKPGALPAYPGSAIRGLIGHGLKKVVCIIHKKHCSQCPLASQCIYTNFFELSAIKQASQAINTPLPWVLDLEPYTPLQVNPGDTYQFHLVLMGETTRFMPYIILAMERAGKQGFGKNTTFKLSRLWVETTLGSATWQQVSQTEMPDFGTTNISYNIPELKQDVITLHLQTPLRLRRKGRLVRPGELNSQHIIKALFFRFRDLQRVYCTHSEAIPLPELPSANDSLDNNKELSWKDWTRWSSRQGTHMQLGGIVGTISLGLAQTRVWWPYLWLGQWIHIGKQTSMGLGQYRVL